MGYVKVVHTKKTEYLTPEEFNEKLDFYENCLGETAEIVESGSRIIAHIGRLVFEANRFGVKTDIPYIPQIAKELYNVSNYHKLSEEPENNYLQTLLKTFYPSHYTRKIRRLIFLFNYIVSSTKKG